MNTVFQNYALFPHMTIGQRRRPEAARQQRRQEAGRRRPGAHPSRAAQAGSRWSAAARPCPGIVNRPAVLLRFDEPLGALDLKLRRQMQMELKRIQTEVGLTFIHVTQ